MYNYESIAYLERLKSFIYELLELRGSFSLKRGVIMDVTNVEQTEIDHEKFREDICTSMRKGYIGLYFTFRTD